MTGGSRGRVGLCQLSYLILAAEGDFADKMRGNLAMQADVGAETYEISAVEARDRHPLLNLADIALIGYEPGSGYTDPYLTTASFLKAARAKVVILKTGCALEKVLTEGGRVNRVATTQGTLQDSQVDPVARRHG